MLLLLLACRTPASPTAPVAPTWTIVAEGLPEAVLSVSGVGQALTLVGSDVGEGPLVLHRRDGVWSRSRSETSGDAWWSWREDNVRWTAGEGFLLRESGTGAIDVEAVDASLFGIWGRGSFEAWAVGSEAGRGVILSRKTGEWVPEALPDAVGSALFKVWGDDHVLYAVGSDGTVLRSEGGGWEAEPIGLDDDLFTVAGDERVLAVGGDAQGVILERLDDAWEAIWPDGVGRLYGVAVRSGCAPVAVGASGVLLREGAAGWERDWDVPTALDLHGVWLDADCGVWAVGGALSGAPLTDGVVLYFGAERPGPIAGVEWADPPDGPEALGDWIRTLDADCEDALWRVQVETSGTPSAVEVELAHSGMDTAEWHPLVLEDRHPQGLWSVFGATLSVDAVAIPGESSTVACSLQGSVGYSVRALGDDGRELECVLSGATLPTLSCE